MTTATLNHPNFSTISLPIRGEAGDPLVSRDFGKPHMEFFESGRLDPLPKSDQWNGLENYTIATQLTGSGAYDDALALANLIKSPSAGSAITFDPSLPAYDSSIDVVPRGEQDEALTLTYPPGTSNWVEVDLGLTRIGAIQGSDDGTRAQTPTASGGGPIELRDNSRSVDLSTGVTVERAVGRPNSSINRNVGDHPRYIEKRSAAYDAFSLDLTFVNNVTSKVTDLIDMFRQRRGRSVPTLDFNGTYGMGAFDVQLQGSAGLRHVARAAEGETEVVPTIDLRVVSTA